MDERIKQTLFKIFAKRNYNINDVRYEFDEPYVAMDLDTDTETITVFQSTEPKLISDDVKKIIKYMESNDQTHGIVVHNEEITSQARKAIVNTLNLKIELFTKNDLKIDITEHIYACPHRKLSLDEIKELKQDYTIVKKLQVMLSTEAMSRYYDFLVGDIIEVKRRNGTISYRNVK